jgi:hypothetical protein
MVFPTNHGRPSPDQRPSQFPFPPATTTVARRDCTTAPCRCARPRPQATILTAGSRKNVAGAMVYMRAYLFGAHCVEGARPTAIHGFVAALVRRRAVPPGRDPCCASVRLEKDSRTTRNSSVTYRRLHELPVTNVVSVGWWHPRSAISGLRWVNTARMGGVRRGRSGLYGEGGARVIESHADSARPAKRVLLQRVVDFCSLTMSPISGGHRPETASSSNVY